MDANELIRAAFGRLGFQPNGYGDGTGVPDAYLVRETDGGTATVGALTADGTPDGYPRAGARCQIETFDSDNEFTGRAEFPDPVSAYTFIRFVSGWVRPGDVCRCPDPADCRCIAGAV